MPRVDDTIGWQGVVARNGITSPIPTLEWFIADADYNAIIANPTADIIRKAVISYNGTVIDNVSVNIRGAELADRAQAELEVRDAAQPRPRLPGLLVEPVDEFAMQADFSDRSHGRPTLAWDAYQRAGRASTHQLFPMRTQQNAQFQASTPTSTCSTTPGASREGYDDKQFFKAETSAFDPTGRSRTSASRRRTPTTRTSPRCSTFLAGLALTGNARARLPAGQRRHPADDQLRGRDRHRPARRLVVEELLLRPEPGHRPLDVIPWDLDHTWGNGCCSVNSNFVTPAEPGDKQRR